MPEVVTKRKQKRSVACSHNYFFALSARRYHLATVVISLYCWHTWLPLLRDCVPPGDSGELVVAAAAGVAPHPPGYPAFALLYHAVAIAARDVLRVSPTGAMNAATAALAWVTALIIGAPFMDGSSSGSATAACLVAMLWASTPTNRMLATQVEVFAVHHVGTALVFALFHQWWWRCSAVSDETKNSDPRSSDRVPWGIVVSLAALCAAVVANQHAGVLAIAPIMLVVGICSLRQAPSWSCRALLVVLCVAAVAAVWTASVGVIYMLRTRGSSHRFWYTWGDQDEGLIGALMHFLRANYGTFSLHRGGLGTVRYGDVVQAGFMWMKQEGLLGALGLCVVGLYFVDRSGRGDTVKYVSVYLASAACCMIGLIMIANVPLTHGVYVHVYHRIWAQASIPIVLAMGHSNSAALQQFLSKTLSVNPKQIALVALSVLLIGHTRSKRPTFLLPTGNASSFSSASDSDVVMPTSFDASCVFDAFSQSATAFLPHGAVVVTVGDMYVSGVRYGLLVRRPDAGATQLHVDRELLSYSWAKRSLVRALGVPKVPASIMGEGYWSVAQLAELNHAATEGSSSSSAGGPRPLYLLESPEFANEQPRWKDRHDFYPQGWFYRIVPKGQQQQNAINCSAFLAALEAAPSAADKDVEAAVRRLGASDPALGMFAHLVGPAALSGVHVEAMAVLYPWESLIVEQFYVARKNMLLHAAVEAQHCLTSRSSALLLVALRKVEEMLLSDVALERHYSGNVHATAVRPFVDMLANTIRQLSAALGGK
jgi:hypothetical protein